MPFSVYTHEKILELFNGPLEDKIFYFKEKSHAEGSPPHYHIALPINDNEYILLVMFTSQVAKIKKFSSINEKQLELLYEVTPNEFSFLTRDSIIDCNDVKYWTKEELVNNVSGKMDIFNENIPLEILDNIKTKIKKSPLVRKKIKKKLL